MSLLYKSLRCVGHQHWIPHGRDRFLRLFAPPDGDLDYDFEVDFFGARYVGNLNNFIDWTVYFYGALAHNELFLMRDIAASIRAKGKQAIGYDIGANIGQHSLYMSLHMDQVIAFEPFEKVRVKIAERLELNGRDNVRIMPLALGDENGSFNYFPPAGENIGTGTMLDDVETSQGTDPIKVDTRRGDDLIRAENLPVPNIMKIDVEGFEPHVLRGMRQTLDTERPFIVMEMLEDTRAQLKNEEGLRDLLYPDADVFEVTNPPGKYDYALEPFEYDKAFEILIAPRGIVETMPDLAARLR